ncbi:MAG: hypothetical protein ACYC57_11190 [Thermoleophilia bacterium]
MAGWVSEQADRWKHGAGIVWNSYLSPVVNVVFDEVFTLADPDSSWSERGIAIVFLASGGIGKAAKGVKLADDLIGGARAIDKTRDAGRAVERAGDARRIVIGENMDRVDGYARRIGAETFTGDGMSANRQWIRSKQSQGYEINDIGPDFKRRRILLQEGKRPDSEFYNMERIETKDYDNYVKVFERSGKIEGGVPGLD